MTENGTVPKGTSKPRKRSTDWSFTVFVISLCMMAFLYGFAANEFDLPPKGLMRQAVSALKALNLIDRTMPTGVNRIEDKPAPKDFIRQLDRPQARNCCSSLVGRTVTAVRIIRASRR